jgi:glutathione synthase/RimK-type ligase-like ATP-grasp enzyme
LKHSLLGASSEDRFLLDEWSEALEGFFAHINKRKWMNHPTQNVLASHKLDQLSRAKELGFRVPDTLVTQAPDQLRAFYEKHAGHVIVKPMGTGYIKRTNSERDSLIYTNRVPPQHLANLDDLPACPTLFQEEIDKVADVRITLVDEDIHAVELLGQEENGFQRCDIRRNNMEDVSYRPVRLPASTELRIRKLVARYALRFAAVDMAITPNGDWVFFEVNPNGQWAWLDLAGVTNIAASFVTSFSGITKREDHAADS